MWGWVELIYADGFKVVLESGEWGEPYEGKSHHLGEGDLLAMLSEEDRAKIDEMPDPEPLPFFDKAIRERTQAASHAERSHRVASLILLANAAIRCGRPIKFDPETEQVVGDEEANRLVIQPMRSPWRI